VELALWRDIALVWLAFLCFIGLVIPLAVALFAVKGMHVVIDRTPGLLRQVQGYSRVVRTQTAAASRRTAAPLIQVHKQSTRYATLLDRLLRRPPSQSRGEPDR
jgi:hypothetical protein